MSKVDCVLDTNILVYAITGQGIKCERASALVQSANWGISAQILQEFYVTVTRKPVPPLSPATAAAFVEQFRKFPCIPIDSDIVESAIAHSERYRISYWDGAIIAAAEVLGASTLYSENLQHGQQYGPVRALNPFAGQ